MGNNDDYNDDDLTEIERQALSEHSQDVHLNEHALSDDDLDELEEEEVLERTDRNPTNKSRKKRKIKFAIIGGFVCIGAAAIIYMVTNAQSSSLKAASMNSAVVETAQQIPSSNEAPVADTAPVAVEPTPLPSPSPIPEAVDNIALEQLKATTDEAKAIGEGNRIAAEKIIKKMEELDARVSQMESKRSDASISVTSSNVVTDEPFNRLGNFSVEEITKNHIAVATTPSNKSILISKGEILNSAVGTLQVIRVSKEEMRVELSNGWFIDANREAPTAKENSLAEKKARQVKIATEAGPKSKKVSQPAPEPSKQAVNASTLPPLLEPVEAKSSSYTLDESEQYKLKGMIAGKAWVEDCSQETQAREVTVSDSIGNLGTVRKITPTQIITDTHYISIGHCATH